jgi:hypothetical protein
MDRYFVEGGNVEGMNFHIPKMLIKTSEYFSLGITMMMLFIMIVFFLIAIIGTVTGTAKTSLVLFLPMMAGLFYYLSTYVLLKKGLKYQAIV